MQDHFLDMILELLADPIPNVRLSATSLLPALKQTIRLPEDVEQLEQLNSAMSNLMTDNDRDVSHGARAVHDTFKRTPVRMAGGAGVLDMNGNAGGHGDFELADRAKEEEEADLTLDSDDIAR